MGAYSAPTNFLADAEGIAAPPRETQTSDGETALISLLLSDNLLTAGNRVLATGEGHFQTHAHLQT